jgi:6-phosphogluconate dehydrogenase
MKIGFIGLGKMGSRMVTRLIKAGHSIVVSDIDKVATAKVVEAGAAESGDIYNLIEQLQPNPIIWLMLPAGVVDKEIEELLSLLPSGAILVDGGNSDYRLTKERAAKLSAKGIEFIDVGTSGGILGEQQGYSLMVGGNHEAVEKITPILNDLAQPHGWGYFGPSGAGHFVKMVHNAIEYGLMESYAEGYRLLKEGPYSDLNLESVAEVWQHGSIVESALNNTIAQIMKTDSELSDTDGSVAESGEAEWSLEVARACGIDMTAIQDALNVRLASEKGEVNYATKLLSLMRNRFGGHSVNKP